MLRVNQAGEYGAVRIYLGQMAALQNNPKALKTLEHMLEQEKEHLEAFNKLIIDYDVPPTLLTPLWHVGGYLMGVTSALLGEKAAHACTIAVEEVIEEHYQSQVDALSASTHPRDVQFKALFQKCQQEESEHKHIAIDQGGESAPFYPILTNLIKNATRLAIFLSKKG